MSRTWTREDLFFDGDEYFNDVIRGIDSAKKSVAFETYIYVDDPIGRRFESALARAAKRGVEVRVVVDGIGARHWVDSRATSLAAEGVQVRVYHPLRIYEATSRFLRKLGVGLKALEYGRILFSRLNRRNHRKVVIVDESRAWVGSLNITADHSAEVRGPENAWRDTAVYVEGPPISAILIGFEYAFKKAHPLKGRREWTQALLKPAPNFRSAVVRQNFTLRLRRRTYQEFLKRIAKARRRIWITNAYLAPSAPVIKTLSRAAQRGVDVRILVPRKSDVFFMPWVAGSHYSALLKSKVKIYEFLPRFLHAKSVLIDNWATVGTSNLNGRSLRKDLEVDIVVRKPSSIRKLARQFDKDLQESEEIRTSPHKLASLVGRLILWVMRDLI